MRVYVCVCVYICIYKYADSYKFIQDPDPELYEKSDPDPGSDLKKIIPDPQHCFAGGLFLIDRKIVLGLANSDVQVLTAYQGKKVKKGLTDLCRRLILIWGRIVLGLGNSDVQVLTAYPGREVKKGLSRLLQEADS
jgi:hypothetical protein